MLSFALNLFNTAFVVIKISFIPAVLWFPMHTNNMHVHTPHYLKNNLIRIRPVSPSVRM